LGLDLRASMGGKGELPPRPPRCPSALLLARKNDAERHLQLGGQDMRMERAR